MKKINSIPFLLVVIQSTNKLNLFSQLCFFFLILIIGLSTIILLIVLFSFLGLKFQYPKFNTYTVSYYIFVFAFGLLIRKPFLNLFIQQTTDLNLVNIFNYILCLIIIFITLTYFRSKLWVILSYSFSKLKGKKEDKRNEGNSSLLQAGIPLSGLLPIDHEPRTRASSYWAQKALAKKYEADKLELVINKLDIDSPLSSGISTRLSAFTSHIGDLYAEALRYDRIARRNQYRQMITSEPRFNDNFDGINSVFE